MTLTPCSAMIFAAGFGTRMGELTRDRPKPMIKVAGKPLIDHALDLAEDAGVTNIVANLHYLAPILTAHLQPKGVLISDESDEILETGGGLKAALPLLGPGPVFTMNSDAIWSGPNPVSLLRAAWDPTRMDALLMCVPVAQALGHAGTGDFTADGEGRLNRGPGLIYGGVQIIKPNALAQIPDRAFSLNLLWDRMHQDGRLFGMAYPGRWCDVGHPDGIVTAEALIADPHV